MFGSCTRGTLNVWLKISLVLTEDKERTTINQCRRKSRWDDTGFISLHEHINTTTNYRVTLAEIDLGTSKIAILQPRL